MPDIDFATRLKQLREAAGLTVIELAEKAGVHRVSLHKLEAGQYEPSLETARKLAAALGVDLNTIGGQKKTSGKSV